MKNFILAFLVLLDSLVAHADIRYLDDILAKATPEERADLQHIFATVQLVPTRDRKTGQAGFSVKRVEPGSVFAREGVKPGDLLLTRNSTKK